MNGTDGKNSANDKKQVQISTTVEETTYADITGTLRQHQEKQAAESAQKKRVQETYQTTETSLTNNNEKTTKGDVNKNHYASSSAVMKGATEQR